MSFLMGLLLLWFHHCGCATDDIWTDAKTGKRSANAKDSAAGKGKEKNSKENGKEKENGVTITENGNELIIDGVSSADGVGVAADVTEKLRAWNEERIAAGDSAEQRKAMVIVWKRPGTKENRAKVEKEMRRAVTKGLEANGLNGVMHSIRDDQSTHTKSRHSESEQLALTHPEQAKPAKPAKGNSKALGLPNGPGRVHRKRLTLMDGSVIKCQCVECVGRRRKRREERKKEKKKPKNRKMLKNSKA